MLILWIIAVGVAAYSNSFDKVFLFDDYKVIKSYSPLEYVWGFNRRWFVNLTFAFNYLLDGHNEAGYHLFNLVIHIISALLLFFLVRQFIEDSSLFSFLGKWADFLSALVASLWIAHPIQTESVTYVCQRYESMMGMCILGFVYFGILYILNSKKILLAVVSLIFLLIGLGTKEAIIVAPFILLIYDYMFIGKSVENMFRRRWAWYSLIIGIVFINIVLLLMEVIRQARMTYGTVLYHVNTGKYLMTQCDVIFHYLRLSLWPDKLCLDKVWDPVNSIWDVWWQLPLIVLLVGATVVCVLRQKTIGFAGVWFFGILAPTSSFIPISDIAVEHRMYLPLAACISLFVLGPSIVFQRYFHVNRTRNFLTAVYSIIIFLTTFLAIWGTMKRNEVYSSQEAMWQDVIKKSPQNYRQHISFIHALLTAGKIEAAEDQAKKLVRKMDDIADRKIDLPKVKYNVSYHASAYNALGCALMEQSKFEEAIPAFNKAISLAEKEVYDSNLVRALKLADKQEEALMRCEEAIKQYPNSYKLYALLGIIYADSQKEKEALDCFEKALRMDPSNILIKMDLAKLLVSARQKDLCDYHRALALLDSIDSAVGWQSHKVCYLKALAYAGLGDEVNASLYKQKAIEILGKTDLSEIEKQEFIDKYKAIFNDSVNK